MVVQEVLPELDATSVGLHLVQYGRPTYEHAKILSRALSLVEKNRGQVVPVGSLSSPKIRSEAQFRQHDPNITSGHFASWCATGENFSFDVKEKQKMIKYTREQNQISMTLEMFSDEDPVQKITERHQQQLICDSLFSKGTYFAFELFTSS
ncbi:TRR [Mytilus edulis]|uniref:TrxB n=1 Tax=Mytilus edulis TaxID=6550 RepID=A0A8S3T0D4_MYTED|nr:TRR [Mytilus edulis]